MASSLQEIKDAFSKAKGYAYLGGMSPLSQRAAEETESLKELYTKDLRNEIYSDMLNKCSIPPDKTSQPKSKLILLLCN